MTELELSLILLFSSFGIGFLGALSGLGGGSILTPILYLFLGVDLHYAMGSSLVAAIATSSGAAAAYVKEGYTNMRVGMFLELATTFGAILGAYLAGMASKSFIAILFGLVLFQSAWMALKKKSTEEDGEASSDKDAQWLNLSGSYPTKSGKKNYGVHNVKGGFAVMLGAGCLSGLLGIGSGPMKVLAMDQLMRLPFKVSTTTSNFMIGVTAAASAGVYMSRGYIDPVLSAPVIVGVVGGSLVGARVLPKVKNDLLRKIFAGLIIFIGAQMIYKGFGGNL